MSFEFIVIGIFLIWSLFYLKLNSIDKTFLLLGLVFLFFSYFIPNVFIFNVSINLCIFVGFCCMLAFVCFYGFSIDMENLLYVLLIYVSLNVISIDFNSFFYSGVLSAIVLSVNILNFKDLKKLLLNVNFSLVICEFFNLIFLLNMLNFSTIFSFEFLKCFVFCNLIIFGIFVIDRILKRKMYEKII